MANKVEFKWLDIIWYLIFVLGFNGYMESFTQIFFVGVLFILFKGMDYFFSDSKLLIGVKVVTVLAILYRSGDYGSFVNPIWLFDLGMQVNLDIQYLAFGNLDRIQSLPMVTNLLHFLIFRELILTDKVGSRFTLIATFAGGSLLMFLSIVQRTSFSVIVLGFFFIGIVKIIFDNMLESKLTFDLDKFTFTLLTSILMIIVFIWTNSSPITVAQELESFKNRIQGGLTSVGSGGDGNVTRLTGYNSNDLVLGGPLALSERPVLKMISEFPVYLRGESKYIYTGAGWTDDIISRGTVPTRNIPLKEYPGAEYRELKISIEVLNGSYPVIFSPLRTQRVDINRGNWLVLANESDLFTNYQIVAGDKYELVVQNPLYREDFLRQNVGYGHDFPYEEYTSLPSTLPDSIVKLAIEITKNYDNNYEKAVAIQEYLRSREFRYSLEVEFTPRGIDFVEHFLEEKEGYCVHFSTAFVVMARSVGIPARWVKGFTSGTRTSQNEYIISDKHAHAWGEIYLPQTGWLTFEPTPGFNRRQYTESGDDTTPNSPTDPADDPLNPDRDTPLEDGEGNTDRDRNAGGTTDTKINYKILSALMVASFMLGAGIFFFNKSKNRLLTPGEKVISLYNKVLGKLRTLGLGKKVSETPKEYLKRLSNHKKIPLNPLLNLTSVFESVYYGNNNLEEKEYTQLLKKQKKYNYFSLLWNKVKNRHFQ